MDPPSHRWGHPIRQPPVTYASTVPQAAGRARLAGALLDYLPRKHGLCAGESESAGRLHAYDTHNPRAGVQQLCNDRRFHGLARHVPSPSRKKTSKSSPPSCNRLGTTRVPRPIRLSRGVQRPLLFAFHFHVLPGCALVDDKPCGIVLACPDPSRPRSNKRWFTISKDYFRRMRELEPRRRPRTGMASS